MENLCVEEEMPENIPAQCATSVIGTSLIVVPLAGLIDLDKEIQRQNKKLATLDNEKKALSSRLDSPKFLENAPREIIIQTKERIKEIEQQVQSIKDLLKSLSK